MGLNDFLSEIKSLHSPNRIRTLPIMYKTYMRKLRMVLKGLFLTLITVSEYKKWK